MPTFSSILDICHENKKLILKYLAKDPTGVPKPPVVNIEGFNLTHYTAEGDGTGLLLIHNEDNSKSRFFPLSAILEISV